MHCLGTSKPLTDQHQGGGIPASARRNTLPSHCSHFCSGNRFLQELIQLLSLAHLSLARPSKIPRNSPKHLTKLEYVQFKIKSYLVWISSHLKGCFCHKVYQTLPASNVQPGREMHWVIAILLKMSSSSHYPILPICCIHMLFLVIHLGVKLLEAQSALCCILT